MRLSKFKKTIPLLCAAMSLFAGCASKPTRVSSQPWPEGRAYLRIDRTHYAWGLLIISYVVDGNKLYVFKADQLKIIDGEIIAGPQKTTIFKRTLSRKQREVIVEAVQRSGILDELGQVVKDPGGIIMEDVPFYNYYFRKEEGRNKGMTIRHDWRGDPARIVVDLAIDQFLPKEHKLRRNYAE
jgi:hypothetical protein